MKKGILSGIIAVFAVMMFTASAYAVANRVELKSSVPNIPKSACYQAGAISMEFGANTKMRNGDIIQFTLNNGVQLCTDIDFYVTLSTGAALTDVEVNTGTGDAAVYASPAATVNHLRTLDGDNLDLTGADVGFRVKGRTGQQVIQLILGARLTATTPDPDSYVGEFKTDIDFELTIGENTADATPPLVTVSLFDEKVIALKESTGLNGPDADVAILKDDEENTEDDIDYLLPIDAADNVICIDTKTFDYQGERVEVTPDSLPVTSDTKLTFSTAREIAKILEEDNYELYECKQGAVVGHIDLQDGQALCPPFDFESGASYCGDHFGNKIIIRALNNPFPYDEYQVSIEVLVNGLPGDNGVYIYTIDGSENGDAGIYVNADEKGNDSTESDICDTTPTQFVEFEDFFGPGACGSDTTVRPGGEKGCTVDCENKVIKAVTEPEFLVDRDKSEQYLRIDLPYFRYDSSLVSEGDVVSVKLTVTQYPCGSIFDEEIVIGTFGCTAPEVSTTTTLLYPYFTPANGSYFWSAYAITNLGDEEGTITLMMYESDGDAFRGEVLTPVPGHTIWSTRLDDSINDPDIQWTPMDDDTGTPGDAAAYIEATTTFRADGFGFIAGSPTGESMGYLPRVK